MTNLWYIVSIASSFVSVILGIGYSILSGSVSELEEKYDSRAIIDDFKIPKNNFTKTLKSSITVVFLFILLRYIVGVIKDGEFIDITTLIIALILIGIIANLIIEFFKYIETIELYSSPLELTKFYTDKKVFTVDKEVFRAIEDLLIYSLKKNDDDTTRKTLEYVYESFSNCRQKNIDYPDYLYNLIRRVTHVCVPEKKINYSVAESLVLNGTLLFGEMKYSPINEKSYWFLWNSLSFAIQHERDDIILSYWRNAHQHKAFYIDNDKNIPKNEIERYLEFHIALGALLLESKRYQCLKEIMFYSNSLPPKYELFPKSITDIFNWLEKFLSFNKDYIFIESKFPIEKYRDVNASDKIKSIISEYLVLLLVRHISLPDYYTYENHTELPELPKTEAGLYNWKEEVLSFVKKVKDGLLTIIDEKKLIVQTDLKNQFDKYIFDIENAIIEQYNIFKIEQVIDESIVSNFQNNVTDEIKQKIQPLLSLSDKSEAIKNGYFRKLWVKKVMPKGAFAKDQHIGYGGVDSSFASLIHFNFHAYYSLLISRLVKEKYLLNEENIFEGISKIIQNKKLDYIIVACRTNIDYWMSSTEKRLLKEESNFYTKVDSKTKYPIYDFWNCHPSLYQKFYILRSQDLPSVLLKKPQKKEINKYNLFPYDKDLSLYGNVIDLNQREDLLSEIPNQENDKKEYALVCLYLTPEFYVNSDANVVEIQVFDRFDNKGVPNAISEVKSWEDIFPAGAVL